MSSSQQSRAIHQDFIARIRYSNALPPPPNPPKLLDIPNTGLSSGQYTNPGFASRLARDQPLNVEADAELGMPIDLVGMRGIFDGDESAIQAPLYPPVPHPHDRALLRPLATLGKPKFSDSSVSFLRRTEYISSYTSKSRFDSTTSKSLIGNTGNRAKKTISNVDKESPEAIKRDIEKGFQTAANNLKNAAIIRHPSKPNLTVVDAYQLLPDHHCIPDAGGFVTIKFNSNPVPPNNTYDARLEASLLKPVDISDEKEALTQQLKEAHERDPERNPAPDMSIEYEFFMTENKIDAHNFKRKFDPQDPEHDSEELYTQKYSNGEGNFRFKRVRAYESSSIVGSVETKYENEVAIALLDQKDGLHQKGAYYYPIVQKTAIRPQRTKNIQLKFAKLHRPDDEVSKTTDYIDMQVTDPDEVARAERAEFVLNPWGKEEEEAEEGETANGKVQSQEKRDENGDGETSD